MADAHVMQDATIALPVPETISILENTTIEFRFEILDSMEVVVALANSMSDAIHAARKYAPAMVVKKSTGKTVFRTP